jgi:hypothetical protein
MVRSGSGALALTVQSMEAAPLYPRGKPARELREVVVELAAAANSDGETLAHSDVVPPSSFGRAHRSDIRTG